MSFSEKKAEILIVDDTIANLKILSSMLSENDYTVRAANSGGLALKTIQISKPDLILLDIRMPDIDGIEVCRQLKANPNYADIPIIFISALKDINDKVLAFQVGGVDYITKPFQIDEVLARVKTQIDLRNRTKQVSSMLDRQEAYYETLIRLKDDLLSIASHDIKNPLSAINSNLFLLKAYLGKDDQKVNHHIKRIEQGSAQILKLVTNILDLARIEMGIEVETDDVPLESFFKEIVENFQTQLETKNLSAQTSIQGNQSARFSKKLIEQVINNLFSNAIKYTPNGGKINLFAEIRATEIYIGVKDNGYGIPDSDIPHLFEKFYRVQSDSHINKEGTGLGLSIAKTIVDKHGGEIGVQSEFGMGSCFFIRLPQSSPKR
ncbi:MAG: hybrid sensor histidine kinase/response regulator [Chloroflexota bacterium]